MTAPSTRAESGNVMGFDDTPRGQLAALDVGNQFSIPQSFAQTPRASIAAEQVAEEATTFKQTARGKLSIVAVEPVTFVVDGGGEYTSVDPGEINRLTLSRDYARVDAAPGAPVDPVTVDNRFHPESATVADVISYLAAFPSDAERVLDEERSGKARSTILGSSE